VLYAGGRAAPFTTKRQYTDWCQSFFEMQMIAEAAPVLVAGNPKLGQVEHALAAAKQIEKLWDDFDGFVVSFAPGAFLYDANLLEIILGEVGKPVVCTTSPTPGGVSEVGEYSDIGLKANLINAISSAAADLVGVGVVMGSMLALASDVIIQEEGEVDVYYPRPGATVARIDFGLVMEKDTKNREITKPNLDLSICSDVYYLNVRINPVAQDNFVWPPRGAGPQTKGLVIDGGEHLKLSITKELPEVPVLLLAEQVAYLYRKGQLTEITERTPGEAAALFVWLLGNDCAEADLVARLQAEQPKRIAQ